ncbi:MAG: CoA-binding protein [Deltaproteobacteria bacterium]|nr:CoA-binding protein [Deltaproteobacteria bacterium]
MVTSQRDLKLLDYVFHPRSIAVIGASNDEKKYGYRAVSVLKTQHFKGNIYPVNPSADMICGLKSYPSVKHIPGKVDLAQIMVPAPLVPAMVKDCLSKGVKIAHIYTSGFSEAGKDGKMLEDQIVRIAGRGDLRIVGPNCLGTYCSRCRLALNHRVGMEVGDVAFVSQSGGLTSSLIQAGNVRGFAFSKAISVGNCADLGLVEFLEYMASDAETEIIAMYIESLRGDGRRFFNVLRKTTRKKPVVIFKSGNTRRGREVAASHTGALTGDYVIWKTVLSQAGAIEVRSLAEMADVISGLKRLHPIPGKRSLAIIGNGGGQSVISADMCSEFNLDLNDLSAHTKRKLKSLQLPAGTSTKNPIDLPASVLRRKEGHFFKAVLEGVTSDRSIGAVVLNLEMETIIYDRSAENPSIHYLVNMVKAAAEARSPTCAVMVVLRSSDDPKLQSLKEEIAMRAKRLAMPVYWDLRSGLKALEKIIYYSDYLRRNRFPKWTGGGNGT